ncbi:enoyl-CoA hydratase [Sphaerisporangium krabiense]|uniref:Enoyl-CoA hydratase n=1 Tax=Sphaerisporangium krabiense TaxID=763782 RepID=A0A7W8Z2D7_9ACTN|nr:enoyl-CoA hydratase/isomerase family protein [Sphaerisporangium krabiense]MBB5626159.1 enoyl-CoA hydratase [Sphaerisporangium krabiense]GII66174.1 enoyl-CoA hydratase [Sphaerisporangium krabiense]
MSGYKTLLVSVEDGLATIALNRPERLNAIGGGLERELSEALAEIGADTSVRAVLLRGEGRAFCVGGDVKEMAVRAEDSEDTAGPSAGQQVYQLLHGRHILETILSVPQPIVAAVHGYAMGLGATIALFCDVVIAAEDAQFADTHVAVGLVAGDGGAVAWPLAMPLGAARYYLMTGDRVNGAEAARLGLALRAVPADGLVDEATAVARKLAACAPLAVQGTKTTVNKILRERMNLLLDLGLVLEGGTFVSDDHKEAAAAFVEKRAPVFRGR